MGHLLPLLLGIVTMATAQQVPDAGTLRAPMFREKILLVTDRTLYAAGDPVFFRIFNFSDPLLKENRWSMVAYLELINERQMSVARGKYHLGEEGASGQLLVPDSVSTGNYTLRAYTRWMRNFSAESFATVPLAVVNPHRPGQVGEGPVPAGQPAEDPAPVEPVSELFRAITEGGIACEPERPRYGQRERVTVVIRTGEGTLAPEGYAISVTRKDFTVPGKPGFSKLGRAGISNNGHVEFPPETRGISVAGKIVSSEDRTPVPYARVHVTLLGGAPDYFAFVADRQGEIRFSVPPRPGVRNALIAFDPGKGDALELEMEDAFSREFPGTPAAAVDVVGRRSGAVREIMVLSQLQEAFRTGSGNGDFPADSLYYPLFYGTPEYRYRPDDYVELPSLEEFFFELVPQVSVRRYRGERSLAMMDDAGFFLEYPPLILMDHVAMLNMDNLLDLEPRFVETIDVVNTIYIRGSNVYGGIIAMRSKQGNLAGAELPGGATIIELQTFDSGEKAWPQLNRQPSSDRRIPDLRATLFWEPQHEMDPGSETRLEFGASDIRGIYQVEVTGVTPEGKVVQGRCEFMVE